jgi:hypothetical protein
MADTVFDRVVITIAGKRESLSMDEFLALPLDTRVRSVLGRAVEFYLHDSPVDRRLALASMRQREASQTSKPPTAAL